MKEQISRKCNYSGQVVVNSAHLEHGLGGKLEGSAKRRKGKLNDGYTRGNHVIKKCQVILIKVMKTGALSG